MFQRCPLSSFFPRLKPSQNNCNLQFCINDYVLHNHVTNAGLTLQMYSSAVKNFKYHNSRLHFKSRTNQFQKEDTRVTQKSVTDWLARLSCTRTCISILIHFSFILDFVQFHPICIFFIWVQSISSSWSKSHYY